MLKIRSLTKTFFPGTPNEVRALRGIDLDLADGCFAAIIGTNGSGKSTLLNAVAGTFLPDTGTLELDGHTITDWPEHRRATLVGRVFQNPFAGTAAEMSIAENIVLATRRGQPRGLGFALSHKTRDEIADRIRSPKMGLEDRLENPIGTLSGGQRQALAAPEAAAARRAHRRARPEERRAGRRAHQGNRHPRKAHRAHGHALDAAGRAVARPHHHDAPRQHRGGLLRRAPGPRAHRRPDARL